MNAILDHSRNVDEVNLLIETYSDKLDQYLYEETENLQKLGLMEKVVRLKNYLEDLYTQLSPFAFFEGYHDLNHLLKREGTSRKISKLKQEVNKVTKQVKDLEKTLAFNQG